MTDLSPGRLRSNLSLRIHRYHVFLPDVSDFEVCSGVLWVCIPCCIEALIVVACGSFCSLRPVTALLYSAVSSRASWPLSRIMSFSDATSWFFSFVCSMPAIFSGSFGCAMNRNITISELLPYLHCTSSCVAVASSTFSLSFALMRFSWEKAMYLLQ